MGYRLIQVGLGDFGRRWLDVVRNHPSWEVAAICTRNDAVRQQCGEICGLPLDRQFTSLAYALDSDVEADTVLVTTPHFRHHDDVTRSLAKGMRVLVEKPLAGSWEGCTTIWDAAKDSDQILMVGENYRFGEGARIAREIVASDEIGRPEFLTLRYFVGHTFPDGDWRNDYDYPLLIENATHQFDLVRYVTGTDPEEVYCSTPGSDRTPHWPYPSVSAQFAMTGGLQFAFTASWAYPEYNTPWEGQWQLYGTKGALSWDQDRITVTRNGTARVLEIPSRDSDYTLKSTFDEFTAAIDENRRAATDIEDNMKTLAMVYASMESSKTHQPIQIPEFLSRK